LISEGTLLQLIELAYDSSTDASRWPRFLERLAVAVGGGMGCITLEHPGATPQAEIVAHGIDDAGLRAYAEHYAAIDPMQPRVQMRREGEVDLGEHVLDPEVLRRSEIFNDWYRPNGLDAGSIGGLVHRRGDVPTVVGLYQTLGSRGYGRDELALLQRLMPHLKRALHIHYRLGAAARQGAPLLSALDTLAFGVVLVDSGGRVLEANRAARRLAAERDGLLLLRGELRAKRPRDTRALQAALAAILGNAGGVDLPGPDALAIPREPPRRPLELVFVPLRLGDDEPGLGDVAAAVLVHDPESIRPTSTERLQALYGLTPREAEVAECFSRGDTIPEIAERLGIAVNNVRARLREIYAKTGTHRQTELARLLHAHGIHVHPSA